MKDIENFFKILKLSAELVKDEILQDQVTQIQKYLEKIKNNETVKQITKEI